MELTVEKIKHSNKLGLALRDDSACIDSEWVDTQDVIDFLLAQLDTIERETAERCVELIKDNMASTLGVDRSWTSFAEEAIRNEFIKENDND